MGHGAYPSDTIVQPPWETAGPGPQIEKEETVRSALSSRLLPVAALCLAFSALTPACGGPPQEEGTDGDVKDAGAIVSGNTNFALDLYARLKGDQNLFFSPYSISTALTMTSMGARGNTEQEMVEVLNLPTMLTDAGSSESGEAMSGGSWERALVAKAFAGLSEDLITDPKTSGYELRIANSLWGQRGYGFLDAFLSTLARDFRAGLNTVDFQHDTEHARQSINTWVEQRTKDKIRDLIQRGMLDPATTLVLVNAVYFNGLWASQFDPEQTSDAVFHCNGGESSVRMMLQKADFGYLETEDFQLLEMPYDGGLSMVVLLPHEKLAGGLGTVEKSLTPAALDSWLADLGERKVTVYFPKFDMTWGVKDIAGDLEALGMRDAFRAGDADFSGIDGTRELFISLVLHKAFIDVNEEGTEAAAATAVVMKRMAMQHETVFRADRPFMFLIRDTRSGSILFMGRMTDPEA
jgi:serpin B